MAGPPAAADTLRMEFPSVASRIIADATRERWPSPASQLLAAVPRRAVTPASNERIRANADAIRFRGIERYA